MLTKTEAIVLRAFKYGESKLIADLFTREAGRVSFIVTLPKTPRGGQKKQYFQPLTLVELEFDHRPKLQLQKLGHIQLSTPYVTIPSKPEKLSIALFTAEFLYHALKGEQQDAVLFDYIRFSMLWLDSCKTPVANFHLVFLMHMSRFLGFFPNLESQPAVHTSNSKPQQGAADSYFDLRAATFCHTVPVHHDFLMPAEAAHIRQLMRMDYATMHLFRMTRQERGRIVEVLLLYYRLHLPDFPELKSLAVLQELYGT